METKKLIREFTSEESETTELLPYLELIEERHLGARYRSFLAKHSLSEASALAAFKDNKELRELFTEDLYVHVSEFFRDINSYRKLEEFALGWLRTFRKLNIWCLGCAHGQESISLATWLDYHHLLDDSTIYATDGRKSALRRAIDGNYTSEQIKSGARNANLLHADLCFEDYFEEGEVNTRIKSRISYFHHDAIYDKSFARMQLISCQNVFIYYNEKGQERILATLKESSTKGSLLLLGKSEFISTQNMAKYKLERCLEADNIYRFL